ncbi:hypothetical protein SNE40_013831 [Patella caerulea]|uniref:Protein kinase domain-containing protein n=1 Tax=Patella caerulea TaxID=87958 RepID=A0AAN8PPF3_PATCE
MQGYKIEYLKALDDFGQVEDIADEWGVNLEGLADLDSMKERLVLHNLKETNQQYFKMDEAGFAAMKSQHEKKRKAMIDLLNKVRESIDPCINSISTVLKAGNLSDDLGEDFSSQINDLQTPECCVVFSGETGAGKSSLLNLLLGEDILPTHSLSCTFLICKLKYGSTYGSKLFYENGSTDDRSYENLEEAKANLDQTVFEKNLNNRASVSRIKEIEIYLPAEILKSGITIVDTPGFGENEKLNRIVAEFLSSKTISAFIYLIKTDNAGGVQEDRLLDFLRDIRKLRKTSVCNLRDDIAPNAAMFICNRWDKITEHEKVKQNALSKLSDAWPGFENKQALFFSTEAASKHIRIDKDYISEDYANLLKQLVNLLQTALDSSIKHCYRWLKKILQQATSHVLSMVSQIDKSDEDLNKKFTDAETKLSTLGTNSQTIVSVLRNVIQDKRLHLAELIKQSLRDHNTKLRIRGWDLRADLYLRRSSTMSLASTISSVNNKKTNSFDAIALRHLVDEIDSWINDNGHADKMATDVEAIIDEHLQGLFREMTAINDEMTDNASIASFSSSSTLPEEELEDLLHRVTTRQKGGLVNKVERLAEGRPDKNMAFQPKVLVARALLSTILAVQSTRRRSNMHTDPNQYLIDRALQFAETIIHDREIALSLCNRYTDPLVQYIHCIEKNIPQFISTTKELIEEIQKARQQGDQNKEMFKDTLRHLEKAIDHFRGFGLSYISDIRTTSLSIKLDANPVLSNSSRSALDRSLNESGAGFTYGICFYTQMGKVDIKGKEICFVSRTSTTTLSEETIYKETVKLRGLAHENIAPFLGIVRRLEKAAFLFSGDFRPLGRFIRNPLIRDIKTKTSQIINGLISGLQYLHKESLVHMELSPKTIMIDPDIDEVKLIGGCLPRRIVIPENNDSQKVGHLVYLSPEVLRGKMYASVDDMYSFGLVIWELLVQENPYINYKLKTQSEFIEIVDPKRMLYINADLPEGLKHVLSGCVFASPENRLSIDDAKCSLTEEDLKPLIDKLRVRKHTHVKGLRISKAGSASSLDD